MQNSSRQGMTSEEMINHSSEWTLAFDNALLNRLKEFSEIVDTASQEVNTECETLAKDINLLQSRVFNVTNEFLMLSNTQFVENRVQEFEETMESNSVPPSINNGKLKTKSEKEVELIAKMKEAIQIGVSTNVQHDKMQLSENQQQSAIPQLKLPHLIGTSKFFSSKFCGLTDDTKTAMLIPEKSTANNISPIPFLSNSSESLPSMPPSLDNIPNDSISTESTRPQFQNSYENDSERPTSSLRNPSTSTDLTKETATVNDWDSTNSSRGKATSSIVEDLNNAFRARLPPPPDDDSESDDDFQPSTNKKLFGDDDDDLFGENSLFASRQHEDMFGKPVVSNSIFSSQRTSNVKSLFSDNEGADDEVRQKSESDSVPASTTQPDKDVKLASETKPKIPAGAVPMFGGITSPKPLSSSKINSSADRQERNVERVSDPSTEVIKSVAHSSQDTEKENKFTSQSSLTSECHQDSKHPSSQGSSSDLHVPNSVNLPPKPKINSLFDENSDDDLFAPSKFSKKSSSLFDDNLKRNSNKSLTKTAQLKPKGRLKQSIFEDSDSGDDLFSSASSSSSKLSKEKSAISNANQFFKPSLSIFTGRATESLFDDQDDDIFSTGQKVKINVASENSNSSDKLRPGVSSATSEIYLPSSKDQPVVEEEKQILKDSHVITTFSPTNVNAMHEEVGKNKQEGPQSLATKNGVTDSDSSCGLVDSITQLTSNEQTINTSAFAVNTISKPDAKISDLNENNSIADGVVNDKDKSQSNPNTISSPVTRPQSLQIQPDKLPSCETTSVQQDKVLFSETSDKTMLHTVDGNSNVKSKTHEVIKSPTKVTFPNEISKRTSPSQSTDAEKEIGKLNKSSVKSIASSLKINQLALRPGSRPPKSTDSTSLPPVSNSDSTTVSDPVQKESNGLLTSVAKNRPKIQQQRRPPSRKLRKANYSAESIDGKEKVTENNGKAEAEIRTPTQVTDAPVFSMGDESEPTSPTVPADILSPSTEEEDIFSIGIESNQRPSYGIEIASPDDDSHLKARKNEIKSVVSQPVVPKESLENNLHDTKIVKPTLGTPQHYDDSSQTSRSLPQNRNSTRITLPSSKITQCSDSDSDDLFSSLGRKISHDFSSQKPKVKVEEDLFSEKSLTKQTLNRQIKSAPPKTNMQTESPEVDSFKDTHTSKVTTESVNGQNRAEKTTKSLFSDSDDEDIFMPKSKAPSKPKVKEKVEKQMGSSVPSLMQNKQKGLFDSDSDDDNLFGTKVKKPILGSSTASQNVITSSKSASVIQSSRAAKLFSDSSDEDIFSSSKPANKASAGKNIVEKQVNDKQNKQPSEDIRHHIFDDPLNNI